MSLPCNLPVFNRIWRRWNRKCGKKVTAHWKLGFGFQRDWFCLKWLTYFWSCFRVDMFVAFLGTLDRVETGRFWPVIESIFIYIHIYYISYICFDRCLNMIYKYLENMWGFCGLNEKATAESKEEWTFDVQMNLQCASMWITKVNTNCTNFVFFWFHNAWCCIVVLAYWIFYFYTIYVYL